MHLLHLTSLLAAIPAATATSTPIISTPGDRAAIPGWNIQSLTRTQGNVAALSQPGTDVSGWVRIGSRGTVVAGLIQSGVYNESQLFYSDNLDAVDKAVFREPWVYREEFTVGPTEGGHVFLHTNGISSKADIWVNGNQVTGADFQDGSYTGHTYEISSYIGTGQNALLIQTYPTDYSRDLAVGFADWNPYPPDNGTGVWRDVEISQTGSVGISVPRIVTDFMGKPDSVNVDVVVDVTNFEDRAVGGFVEGVVESDDEAQSVDVFERFSLNAREVKTVSLKAKIDHARIWWPAQWGEQPLYTVELNASVGTILSDKKTKQFGIRQVTSQVNQFNDTAFNINGHPFLVLGAGYSPDLFLRFDATRVRRIFQYVLDMGLNTVRLEGKMEQPELYDLADQMGLMVIAGWECCDKWEGWAYNNDAPAIKWTDHDYAMANASILHETAMLQSHPSMLAFLIGSDYWPDDRATSIYVSSMTSLNWTNPIIASASKRGYAKPLGPSGMKMNGPYDWVPPNYWYGDKFGAAFGFGSEQGAGVGTPEIESLRMFMNESEMESLWKEPKKGQYHMSQNYSNFYDRSIYNAALFGRYGAPRNLEDYIAKAQIMDYEATRAEFEAFSIRQYADHPATGVIYWMLNGAWPNLHWQLFDYYLRPIGAYFGMKAANRREHVVFDYGGKSVWVVNHDLVAKGERVVVFDLISVTGESLGEKTVKVETVPSSAKKVMIVPGLDWIQDTVFLRLILQDPRNGSILSRNVYWLSAKDDVLDWDKSTWINTPTSSFADYTALNRLPPASVNATVSGTGTGKNQSKQAQIRLKNTSKAPAFFMKLTLRDATGNAIAPVYWSDNYITLFESEQMTVTVEYEGTGSVEITGQNIGTISLKI